MIRKIRSIVSTFLLVLGMFLLLSYIADLAGAGWNFQAYGKATIQTGFTILDDSFLGDYVLCSAIMLLGFICDIGATHYTSGVSFFVMLILEILIAPIVTAYILIAKIVYFFRWISNKN